MRRNRATLLCAIAPFAAAIAPLISTAGCGSNGAAAPGAAPNAWATHALWDDGQAEVNAYDAVEIRYGQPRPYTDYQVTVKEPFSRRLLVKADPGHDPADVFQVLKLNRVLRYQTGIYSYNQMLSVFFDPADMQPAKWTLAHSEWCGNTFKQFTRRDGAARLETRTYWDGDADQNYELEFGAGTVFYDQLPTWLRSQPLLPSTRRVRIYPSEIFSKGPRPRPVEASITAAVTEEITLADGSRRRAAPIRVELADGAHRFWIDPEFPHLLLGWERPDGGRGRLRWSKRLKYWELHDTGDERHLNP
jgi:hypothetical protein